MHWTILLASLAALLSSDHSTAQAAITPPEDITIPFLKYYTIPKYEPGKRRRLTWLGNHGTPPEILQKGMDPASPSTNEWIARAHYMALVQQFEEWKLYKAGRSERHWQNFYNADFYSNPHYHSEGIEALFDYEYGTLTVACFYSPVARRHFISTVPRGKISDQISTDARRDAPVWHAAVSSGSLSTSRGDRNTLRYHAEDGAFFFFERRMRADGKAYRNGRQYMHGAAIGAWGGRSNYNTVGRNGQRTTTDPEGRRFSLCPDYYNGRGNRGCRTVASLLGVAFNGDGANRDGDYERRRSPCPRDGKPVHIRGREVACPLNLHPTATSHQGVQAASKTLKAASHEAIAATATSRANRKSSQTGLKKHESSAKPEKTSLNKHASSGKPTRTSAKKLDSSPPKPTKTGLKKLSSSPKSAAKTAHPKGSASKKTAAPVGTPAKSGSTLSKNGKGRKP